MTRELIGLRGGKFQGYKVKEEPKALDSVGGVLWTHNFGTASAENGASTQYVTPGADPCVMCLSQSEAQNRSHGICC